MGQNAPTKVENVNNIKIQPNDLTDDDKNSIKYTWRILSSDMLGNGGKLLLRILEQNNNLKEIIHCGGLEGKELIEDSNFKLQALRFMQVLGASVDNIDQLESAMGQVLLDLGKQHYSFEGFIHKYWNLFPEAVLYVWKQELREKFPSCVQKAWSILLLLIISKLKEGYHHGCIEDTTMKLTQVTDDAN